MPDDSANTLADRVRGRDPAALAELLEQRRPAILAFIDRRLGSALRGKVEPQDIFQDLSVKALRELPDADMGSRDPFSWLCHLAEQVIVDDSRHFAAGKRATRREVPGNMAPADASQDFIALLAASLTSPTQAVVRDERQRRLQEAMASFPVEHREVLRLRYVDGLATKEVALRLSKSDVSTRVLLTRLVQKLQELLGPGEDSEPPA